MEMLSSATKMDIFPTFLQSEKDFDEDFNYITSSGTTLGEMLSTENFLESYGYDSKSPDDIFAEDVVYETNDFVSIIKQEAGFEYPDYQMNTSPESEMSSYEDQLQLVNTSNDLMSVDLEYLLNMQKASAAKQENENVVVKVESNLLTDESVPVLNHEASAETSTNNGLQYLFEGGIVKAEKEFDWKAGFEDIDCVVPSLFMDATSGHHASNQVVVKSEPTVKNDITNKREVTEVMSTKSVSSKFIGNASTEEVIVDEVVKRTQTNTSSSVKNGDSKRSAPEMDAKSNKKLKKPVDNEDGEERLKKAVNNVKLRQQKKFDEGRLREQKRKEEEFQKKARERAQYFSKQIASGAIQMKPAEEKEEKKPGCLQKKKGRKLKAASSPEGPSNVNDMPVALPSSATSSSSSKVNVLSDLSSKSSSKGSAVQLTTQQPSSASLVISTSQQQVKSIINSSVSKRSPKVNVVLTSSVASELCQTKAISTASVKRSPSTSSLPISLCRSESSASPHQVDSLGSFPSKRSPTANDVSSVVASSSSSPITSASCLLMKTDGSLMQSTTAAAAIPTKVNTLSTGVSCGKMSSILNKRPQRPLAVSVAKGGVSILKSSAAHTSLAVANSASKPFSASSSANTLVTYAVKAQTSLLKMPIMAGASVLRAPTQTQLQNLLPNEVNSIRFHQGKCAGVQSTKFVSVSAAVAQNSTLMSSSSGQKPWTGINTMPIVISGNTCPPDIVKSEAAETMIARSAECQSVAENKTPTILKQEPEIKQNFSVDVKTELIDDYANQSNQSSTTGAGLLTESSQDGNNNEKKKENKKRLNVSEYMNRLKERSRNELSETKPQMTNEGLGTSAIKPRITNENHDGNYSVLDEHNYCIRSEEQPSNDLSSQRINSSESNVLTSSKMIFSSSDGTIFRLKARTSSTPASVTTASAVNENTGSSRPVPSVAATNDHRSRQPVTHSSCSSLVVPVKNSVSGKISSDVTTSFDVRRQTSVSGKVACAANSTSGRQWKLIPHNLQVTLVSFRDAIGQKVISSNGHQSPKLDKADLNQVETPLLPSVTSNAGNVSAFDCESSRPSKVISSIEVASQEEEEFNSCPSFSGASDSQSTFSTSPENSIVDQSDQVADSVADSLPSDQLLSSSSSCALTSVSAEKTTQQSSICALSSSASANRDKMRLTRRTSRNRRVSRSSRSSRSSSSDSCRSRSPIRQHRRSRDESSSSSYCSRSPSRQRNRRDYRRNSRYNRYERKWQSDDFMSDNKDKVREKKIYVGGIPDDCTPLELKERFQHFGEITKVSVHPQTEQENYGFLTFRYTNDALRLKEEGHKVAGCEGFHFCYGDRRSFCKEDYKDFDNMWSQSWDVDVGYHAKPKQSEDAAFEDMLKAHLRDQRRKNH